MLGHVWANPFLEIGTRVTGHPGVIPKVRVADELDILQACANATAQKSSGPNPSSSLASGERGGPIQADAVHERISMPMHELPFGLLTAKDLCDTQRPVLLG
jgi:hypothetical protein